MDITQLTETYGTVGRRDTELTRTYKIGADVVRVRVLRNEHAFQSFATAHVLTSDRTWTEIATSPTGRWHKKAQSVYLDGVADQLMILGVVADELLADAQCILSALQES